MSSVVVVDDVSPIAPAGYVDRVGYSGFCVNRVFEARQTIFFAGCVRNVN